MASFTWNYWVLQVADAANGYEATGSATVTRDAGSDTATVTGKMITTCLGGDLISWTLHMKVGSTEYTTTSSETAHTQDVAYTMSMSKNISVSADAGTLTVKLWLTLDGFESYTGGKSEVKSATLSYGSKGASTITSASNITLGNACSITWTPLSTGFKYKLRFILGDWTHTTGYISPASTSTYTYTGYTVPATSDVLYEMPDSRKAAMTVILYSYDEDGNKLGSDTSSFKVTCPSSVAPYIASITKSGVDSTFGVYVVGYSAVTVRVIARGIYGSTPKTIKVKVEGVTYTADFTESDDTSYSGDIYEATITTSALATYGSVSVVVKVTDSRSISTSVTNTITVYDYHAPQIDNIEISTSDANTTATIAVTGTISSVNNLNTKYLKINVTRVSDSTTTTVYAKTSQSSYSISRSLTVTLSDIETESYRVTAFLYDSKYTGGVSKSVNTGIVCVSRLAGGLGLAIFREATYNDLGTVGIKGRAILRGRNDDDDSNGRLDAGNVGLYDYRTDDTKVFVLGRTATAGDGGLWLFDTDGTRRIQATPSGLLVIDSNSVTRASQSLNGFRAYNSAGVLRSDLTTSGGLVLYDSNGTMRSYLDSSSHLYIYDEDGNIRIAFNGGGTDKGCNKVCRTFH